MIGRTILHYKILEKLGEGGMGVVYKAEDTKLKREVAIKFLPHHISSNEEVRKRFEIEAQTAASLNHSNIATVYSIEESGDNTFIVMEFIDGVELKDKIKSGPIQTDEAINIAKQISEGLDAAHKKGIVHRDIKSQNIMITNGGKVKIMDFGLAKLKGRSQLTKMGTTVGTISYMSPEQAKGEDIDHRTDIWSFGIVLYEMLTGQLPFKGEYDQAVIYSILNEMPVFSNKISKDLRAILKKCMTKNLKDRYANIRSFINDINSSNLKIKSTPNNSIKRKDHRVVFLSAIVILIVVLIFFWKYTSSEEVPSLSVKKIAVLPFKNLNGDNSQEYFSDGMTETIISDLANIGGLSIISGTSSMSYKNSGKTIKEIGQELNVTHILEGSVLTSNNKVRIFSQLIDINTDTHLWAQTYDREMKDIFSIQTDVANNIAAVLELTLAEKTRNRIMERPTKNLEAYHYYLRGQYFLNKGGPAGLDSSILLFTKSVALDSNFAMAYAELARAYILKNVQYDLKPNWEEKAYVSFQEALSLDTELAEAYVARGTWYWAPDNNFQHENAIRDLQKAIDLKPSLSSTYELLALIQLHVGLLDKALENSKKALELEPTSMWSRHFIGQIYYFKGNYLKALEIFETVEEQFNPVFRVSFTALTLFKLGRIKEAEILVKKELQRHPSESQLNSTFAIMLASQKKYDQAIHHMNIAIENQKSLRHIHHLYYNLGVSSALMNDKQKAVEWLEKSAEDGFPCYPFFKSDPLLENIKSERAYLTLISDLKDKCEYFKTL